MGQASPKSERKNQRQRDALTEGKEKPVRESEEKKRRRGKCERGQIYQTISRSHKGEGTSETAGALGNSALLSSSFTSGPKWTWKPTTHADKTSHCCYHRLLMWRAWAFVFHLQTPSSSRKKGNWNKQNCNSSEKKKYPLISDKRKLNEGKYCGGEPRHQMKRTRETFSSQLSRRQGGRNEREKSTTHPWRDIVAGNNKQQIDQTEWTREKERWRGEQELDNWQRVEAAFAARQAAQLELKAPLRHNEDVAAN